MRKVGWNRKKVRTLITHHMSGPSPTCEGRNMSDSSEWGLLKTTAVVWEGWNPNAHKVPPKIYWNNPKIQVKSGDVIVTKAGPRDRVGVVVYVDSTPPNLMVSGKMVGLRPDNRLIDGRVLASILSSDESQRYLDARTTGMADSQLNFANEFLLEMEVDVPPIEQHIYIGAIASLLRTQITKTKALIEKYQQIKAGLMHDLFTRGIGADGKPRPAREQAPELYQQTPIGWIPKEWSVLPLSESLQRIIDYRGKTPDKTVAGIPLVTAKNVRMGYIDPDPMEFIAELDYDRWMTRGIPKKGDVLFTTEAPLGNVARISTDEPIAFAQRVIILQPSEQFEAAIIAYRLMTAATQASIARLSSGSTALGIKQSELRKVKVALPTNKREQQEIISRLGAQSELLSRELDMKKKLQSQKTGLMHDLLTGHVQVNVEQPEATVV